MKFTFLVGLVMIGLTCIAHLSDYKFKFASYPCDSHTIISRELRDSELHRGIAGPSNCSCPPSDYSCPPSNCSNSPPSNCSCPPSNYSSCPPSNCSNSQLQQDVARPSSCSFYNLPVSSVVSEDFGNFANVMAPNHLAQNHLSDELNFCPQPTGCSASDWSLTVVIPCHRRLSHFEEMTSAVAASTARIDRIIFTLNGSPEESTFMTKIHAFKSNADVLAKKTRIDTVVSSVEIGFFFRFQVAQVLDTQFVAFIDDDQHIGPTFLQDCLKLLHIKKTLGLCGYRGATYKVGSPEWRSTLPNTALNQYLPRNIPRSFFATTLNPNPKPGTSSFANPKLTAQC